MLHGLNGLTNGAPYEKNHFILWKTRQVHCHELVGVVFRNVVSTLDSLLRWATYGIEQFILRLTLPLKGSEKLSNRFTKKVNKLIDVA